MKKAFAVWFPSVICFLTFKKLYFYVLSIFFFLFSPKDYRGIVDDNRLSTNIMNQSLIRRFNHHSTMVLRTCQNEPLSINKAGAGENNSSGKTDLDEAKGPSPMSSKTENGRFPKPSTSRKVDEEPVLKKVTIWSVYTWTII